jgi:hypothetical protein
MRVSPSSSATSLLLAVLVACEAPGLWRERSLFPEPEIPPVDAAKLLVWRDSTVSNFARPAVDANAVYFLNTANVLTALSKSNASLLWRVSPFTGPSDGSVSPGMMMVGGKLIVNSNGLIAVDPLGGAVRWRFVPSVGLNPGYTMPVSDGATIYTGSKSGHLYAVNAADGSERWAVQVAAGSSGVIVVDPVLADGVVYAGISILAGTNFRSSVGGAVAVDASTGTLLWKREFPLEVVDRATASYSGVAVAGSALVVPSGDGTVYGLDRASGAIRTRMPLDWFTPGTGPPDGAQRFVLFATSTHVFLSTNAGYLTAIAATDLRRLYTIDLRRGSASDIIADDKYVYVSHYTGLGASNISDGSRVWFVQERTFIKADPGPFRPALDGTRLHAGGFSGVFLIKRE